MTFRPPAILCAALLFLGCERPPPATNPPVRVLSSERSGPAASGPVASAPAPAAVPGAQLSPEEAARLIDEKLEADPYERSQTDVVVQAWAEGRTVKVAVRNRTRKPLLVGPKNFALILPGDRKPHPFPARVATFPPASLEPDTEQVGLLPVPKNLVAIPKGARVAFSHPQCRPAVAPVE